MTQSTTSDEFSTLSSIDYSQSSFGSDSTDFSSTLDLVDCSLYNEDLDLVNFFLDINLDVMNEMPAKTPMILPDLQLDFLRETHRRVLQLTLTLTRQVSGLKPIEPLRWTIREQLLH